MEVNMITLTLSSTDPQSLSDALAAIARTGVQATEGPTRDVAPGARPDNVRQLKTRRSA
jgi:sugar phosphate isomerase/epimerase